MGQKELVFSVFLKTRYFKELNTTELYELLKARSEIFVVEQNCVYQDLDDRDYESLHVFYEEDGKVIAYLRAFRKEEETVQIGRVLTVKHGTGLGGKLLKESDAEKLIGTARQAVEQGIAPKSDVITVLGKLCMGHTAEIAELYADGTAGSHIIY